MAKQRDRTPLDKLLKHWARATAAERSEFLRQVTEEGQPDVGVGHVPPIANGRYLLPQTVQRIERIIIARRITPAEAMLEMGFERGHASLTRALARGASLRLSVIAALQTWIAQNEAESVRSEPPEAEAPEHL
ncbi:hypothetical protein [Rhizobium sp. SAFR-030]|uniref:hypothetical protein n=1 Tax=Rhizobium sp. SAFR-030 TaxID=3387277 RepID=UPI003F7CE282